MAKSILIIGSKIDPHVRAVASSVQDRDLSCVVLDGPGGDSLAFSYNGADADLGDFTIGEGYDVAASGIGAVWFRLKPLVANPAWGPIQTSTERFVESEWRSALRALPNFIPQALWINKLSAQTIAVHKAWQLRLAQECGFRIPSTRITNDLDVALQLFKEHKRVIYKSLDWFAFPDNKGILAQEVTQEFLETRRDALRRAPGIFQEFIPKKHELRINIVSNRIFPSKINTPSEGPASIDWRHAHFEDIFEPVSLTEKTEGKLLEFHRRSGLHFGAYDLIVTQEGEIVFLECNPSGQYLWLENCLSQPISAALADDLVAACV